MSTNRWRARIDSISFFKARCFAFLGFIAFGFIPFTGSLLAQDSNKFIDRHSQSYTNCTQLRVLSGKRTSKQLTLRNTGCESEGVSSWKANKMKTEAYKILMRRAIVAAAFGRPKDALCTKSIFPQPPKYTLLVSVPRRGVTKQALFRLKESMTRK